MPKKTTAPFLGMVAIATTVVVANNCIRTLAQEDADGNQISACDVATPPEPSDPHCEGNQSFSDPLTKAVGGFPFGRQSMQLAVKYCQWAWVVDSNNDGICDSVAYTSVAVGSTEASGGACPAATGIH